MQVVFNPLEHRVRIELDVPHHLGKDVPLHLCKGKKYVLVREQRVVSSARFLGRAVDDPLCALADLVRGDVEVVYLHCCLPRSLSRL